MRFARIWAALAVIGALEAPRAAGATFLYEEDDFDPWIATFQSTPVTLPPGADPVTYQFEDRASGGPDGAGDSYIFGAIHLSESTVGTQNGQLYMWNPNVYWAPTAAGQTIQSIHTTYDSMRPPLSQPGTQTGPVYIQMHGGVAHFYQNTGQLQFQPLSSAWTFHDFGTISQIGNGWQQVMSAYSDSIAFNPGATTWFGVKAAVSGAQGTAAPNDHAYYMAVDNYHVDITATGGQLVNLSSEVPEPTTLALGLVAGAAALLRRSARGRAGAAS